MTFYAFIPFITSVTVFFWGAFVFSKDTKDLSIKLFLILSIITTYESAFEYIYITSNSVDEATMWFKYHVLGWPIFYAVQLHFLVVYSGFRKKKEKLFFTILYSFTIIMVACLSFFDLYSSIIYNKGGWIRVPLKIDKISEIVFATYMSILTFAVAFIGVKYWLKSSGRAGKLRAGFILAGILIPTWLPSIKNAFLPEVFNISVLFPDSIFTFSGWLFLTIAILYFKMFEITPKTAADNILSTMNEALILTDIEGKPKWANNRYYELFELDEHKLDEAKFEILKKKNMDAVGAITEEYEHEGKEAKNLITPLLTFKDNRIYTSISSSYLKNDLREIVGVVTIFNDVQELVMAQQELKDQQKQMLEMAHQAGMSEVTTSVMHNIGNILNSVNVSSEFMNSLLSNSKLPGLLKANEMLLQHQDNLANFLTNNPKGQLLPDYYQKLGEELQNEHENLKHEGSNLLNKIKVIKDAIDLQQDYSRVRNLNEPINLKDMIDEVTKILEESFKKNNIEIKKEYDPEKDIIIMAPSSKLINVLLNVIKNALESVKSNKGKEKLITIKIIEDGSEKIQIIIDDNGVGIPKEIMPNIFKFGYTTKPTGHGYGLHFCANVLNEMNGSIFAKSKGVQKGAEFRISLPKEQA